MAGSTRPLQIRQVRHHRGRGRPRKPSSGENSRPQSATPANAPPSRRRRRAAAEARRDARRSLVQGPTDSEAKAKAACCGGIPPPPDPSGTGRREGREAARCAAKNESVAAAAVAWISSNRNNFGTGKPRLRHEFSMTRRASAGRETPTATIATVEGMRLPLESRGTQRPKRRPASRSASRTVRRMAAAATGSRP